MSKYYVEPGFNFDQVWFNSVRNYMILNSRLVSGGDIDRGYVYTLNNISLKIDV